MKILIFGASGDLAKRKLFPSLSRVNTEGVQIIGYARTRFDKPFPEILGELYPYDDKFLRRIVYLHGSYDDLTEIKKYITPDTSIYLSVPPTVYRTILDQLKDVDYKNISIEKPFGNDIEDLRHFKKHHSIDKLIFIDHFLLKPMFVAWPTFVGANKKLRDLLNRQHVGSVDIIFKEEIGGEGRMYFDEHGLVKDVVLNHLTELMILAAEDPKRESCVSQAAERCNLLKDISIIEDYVVFGQYDSYQAEMKRPSKTETYSVIALDIANDRWYNVPFITIAGKGLDEKRTEIVYNFKRNAFRKVIELLDLTFVYLTEEKEITYTKIVCNLSPVNEIYIEIGIVGMDSMRFNMYDYRLITSFLSERYEDHENHEIVFDCLIKDRPFECVHFEEAEMLWDIYDEINKNEKPIFIYPKNTSIPIEALELIAKIKHDYRTN